MNTPWTDGRLLTTELRKTVYVDASEFSDLGETVRIGPPTSVMAGKVECYELGRASDGTMQVQPVDQDERLFVVPIKPITAGPTCIEYVKLRVGTSPAGYSAVTQKPTREIEVAVST